MHGINVCCKNKLFCSCNLHVSEEREKKYCICISYVYTNHKTDSETDSQKCINKTLTFTVLVCHYGREHVIILILI